MKRRLPSRDRARPGWWLLAGALLCVGSGTPAGAGPREALDWDFDQRAYPLGSIPEGARLRAVQGIARSKALARAVPELRGGRWVNIGPAPIVGERVCTRPFCFAGSRAMSGRVAAIAVDPEDPSHVLIGAALGGIWETIAGSDWIPKTDDQASLAIGAIAFAPSDHRVIYAGTGEGETGYFGAGVLKSIDGGASWRLLASSTFAGSSFTGLQVDPANPDVVLGATNVGIAGGPTLVLPPVSRPKGIFKSTDGGNTWSRKLDGLASDLKADATDFRNQYAGIGDQVGSPLNGIYRSTDAGETWARLDGPWNSIGVVGQVKLAIAPSNPRVVYVSIQDATCSTLNPRCPLQCLDPDDPRWGALLGLFVTSNGWDPVPSWTQIPTDATDGGTGVGYCGILAVGPDASRQNQCEYDHVLIVDPTDAGVLYAGGIPLWKAEFDGTGYRWTEVSNIQANPARGIHLDQHAMAWDGVRLFVGNDGGVWSTTDGGNSWLDHNTTLSTIQFYEGSLHPTNPLVALGGSQDNGTELWGGTSNWPWIFGGDGSDNVISSSHPDSWWAVSSQNLHISRTRNGGGSFVDARPPVPADDSAQFIARFEKCPANEDVFIAGTTRLWRSTDFFSADPKPSWSVVLTLPDAAARNRVSALAFAASDTTCRTFAFGSRTGQLGLVTDGTAASLVDLDPANAVPNRYVTRLAFDPTDANVLYATLSGFDEGTPSQPGHVFKTTNALAARPTWTDVSPPANLPFNALALDPRAPRTVFVGTDVGVWISLDGGAGWSHTGPEFGMPNVPVYDLQVHPQTSRAVAFTYGRGAFALDPPATCSDPVVIPSEGGSFTAATFGAGNLQGTCGGAGPELVFQWTPAVSGTATIATCGSSLDTVLYVRRGTCATGPEVACANDTCGRQERLTPEVTAGVLYFIVVDGARDPGRFTLTVTPPTAATPTTTRPPATTTSTTSTTTTLPPVMLAVGNGVNVAEFCVDLSLTNTSPVRALEGTLVDVPDEFALARVECTARTAGFSCTANEVAASNRIHFVVVSLGSETCIGPGAGPVARVCLRDRAPACGLPAGVRLELEAATAAACGGQPLGVRTVGGAVACQALGDCVADGRFDILDVLETIDLVLERKTPTPGQRVLCDDTCDGRLDIFDVVRAVDALLERIPRPLGCPAGAAAVVANAAPAPAPRVSVRGRAIVLENPEAAVRGVEVTLAPVGGPGAVRAVRATRRTRGFTVAHHQAAGDGAVRLLVVSPDGEALRPGRGPIARLATAKRGWRVQAATVAR